VEILGAVPLFRGLEDSDLKAIAKLSKDMTFKTDETIVKEGDGRFGFYVIIDGRVEVRKSGKKVAELKRGSFFGELSLLDDQPRSADVVATEPTKCKVILRWSFWTLLSENKNVMKGLFSEMARRLRATDEAIAE